MQCTPNFFWFAWIISQFLGSPKSLFINCFTLAGVSHLNDTLHCNIIYHLSCNLMHFIIIISLTCTAHQNFVVFPWIIRQFLSSPKSSLINCFTLAGVSHLNDSLHCTIIYHLSCYLMHFIIVISLTCTAHQKNCVPLNYTSFF